MELAGSGGGTGSGGGSGEGRRLDLELTRVAVEHGREELAVVGLEREHEHLGTLVGREPVGLGALLVWSFDAAKVECRERGGWFTMVGGYPACLPPGGKP